MNFIIIITFISLFQLQSPLKENLLEKSLKLKEAGDYKGAIEQLEKYIKTNNNAEAYYHLGDCYFKLNTVQDRTKADYYLTKALLLDPKNTTYLITMGKLKKHRKDYAYAKHYFKRVIKLEPNNYEAYLQLGEMCEKDGLWYIDMRDGPIIFKDFAIKKLSEAKEYLTKALKANPEKSELYYKLGICYLIERNWLKMFELFTRAINLNPKNKDAFLFLGYTLYKMRRYSEAFKTFQHAATLMSEKELIVFNDVTTVISPNLVKKYEKLKSDKNYPQLCSAFWKSKDPSFLTEYNERLMEHYCRIALANLRFSIPEMNVEGWESDRGKVLIRFGEPIYQNRTRPSISGGKVNTSKEVMVYKDMVISFEDPFMSGNFKLLEPLFDPNRQIIPLSTYQNNVYYRPEIYDSEYNKIKVPVYSFYSEFKNGSGNTQIEIYYGMPLNEIYLNNLGLWKTLTLREGIFLFDKYWNKVSSRIREVTVEIDTIDDYKKKSILQSNLSLIMPPGTYNLALEFEDIYKYIFGSKRGNVELSNFNTDKLCMSDLVLGLKAKDNYYIPSRFKEYKMKPVPSLAFQTHEKINLYFEIYNLTLNQRNQSGFELVTSITFDKSKQTLYEKALETIKKLTGQDKKIEMSITTEFSGQSKDDIVFQTLDIGSLVPGFYNLKIQVKDSHTNRIVSRERGIEIF